MPIIVKVFFAIAYLGIIAWIFIYPVLLYQFVKGGPISEDIFAGIVLYGSGAVSWLAATYGVVRDIVKDEMKMSKQLPASDEGYLRLAIYGPLLILLFYWLITLFRKS